MSTDITTLETTAEELNFTQFYGGDSRGLCMQLTQSEKGYIALNKRDVYNTINVLANWLKDVSHNEANQLQERIKNNKELMGTIYKEALDCEKFIRDLQVIDLPLRLLDLSNK